MNVCVENLLENFLNYVDLGKFIGNCYLKNETRIGQWAGWPWARPNVPVIYGLSNWLWLMGRLVVGLVFEIFFFIDFEVCDVLGLHHAILIFSYIFVRSSKRFVKHWSHNMIWTVNCISFFCPFLFSLLACLLYFMCFALILLSGVIEVLVNSGRQMEAINLAYAFELTEQFDPVSLLKAYLKDAKKASQVKGGNMSPGSQVWFG